MVCVIDPQKIKKWELTTKFIGVGFEQAITLPNDPLLIRRLRNPSVNFSLSRFTSLSFGGSDRRIKSN
jgi:hypothetical protein